VFKAKLDNSRRKPSWVVWDLKKSSALWKIDAERIFFKHDGPAPPALEQDSNSDESDEKPEVDEIDID